MQIETLQATAGEMRGESSPLLSSSFSPSPSALHEYIIRRHWLTATGWCWDAVASPLPFSFILSSFHPSIPHTFHVVIEFGWLPVPWITSPPGSLFSLSAGQISHSPSPPQHSFFHFLFTSLYTFFYLLVLLPMQVSLLPSASLSIPLYHSIIHSLSPLSVHRRCNWSTTFPHIVIFKSLFASQRRESDCFILFRFPDMVLGR